MKKKNGCIALGCFALALLTGCATAPGDSTTTLVEKRPGFSIDHGEKVHEVAAVQVLPKLSKHIPPQYPFTLPTHGIEASVMLIAVVLADGSVGELSVESSTNAEFEPSAVEAVRQWKFLPALRNDEPVACRIRVPVEFNKPRPKSR